MLENQSFCDKSIILIRTGIKAARGIRRRIWLGKAHGLLLIGAHVTLSHARNIYCGKNVKFEDYSEIQGLCRDGLYFGDGVTIGRGTMIRPSSYYGGDLGYGLTIGDNSSIGPHGYVGCSGSVIIGKNVMIGPKVSIFAENHIFRDIDQTIKSQGVRRKGIIIEDDCWIGSNVIILDGVRIGQGSVIAAGTIVTNDVPPYSKVIDRLNKKIIKR